MTEVKTQHFASRRSLLGVVLFVLILAIGQFVVTNILFEQVDDNTRDIAKHEVRDHQISVSADEGINGSLDLTHHADYRQCIRGMATRATLNQVHIPGFPKLRVYDCRPNLFGGTPTLLSAAQEQKFIVQVQKGVLP